MKHLFWGLLLAFIVITPITAQKQTTILSSSTALDLMSKARKNDLHYNEYLNIGYYLLRENKPDHANRYFSMAAKKYLYFNKQYKYLGRNKLAKKLEKLQNETDSLINLNYLTTTNPKVLKEIELYKSVTKKSYSKLIQLIEDEQQKNKILSRYLVRWGKKSKILKTFIPEYHELMKPKTEFETKTQYKARKNKYEIHEKEATKEIDQRIEKIEIPFDKALKACASQKSKVKKRKGSNEFIKRYPPILAKYSDNRNYIKDLKYNAEKQEFTIVVRFKNENNVLKPYLNKTYTVQVPQNEAQQFKVLKESNQYFFFLQDLRAVISGGKTYLINPINTWYTRLNCDKKNEKATLLVNNSPNTKDINTYLKNIISKQPSFIKEAKRLQESYLSDHTKGVRAEISIAFDEKGKYKHTYIEYKIGNRLATENLHRDGSDKQGGAKGSLLYSVNEIMKKQHVNIIPPTKQCQPQLSSFTFDYPLSKK